jgi:hypothetical protein
MEHKNQHFVAKCYLEAWCDTDCPPGYTPYVWRFSKDGKELKKKSPEKIFRESEMYTIHLDDGSRDLTLEQGLNQLESLFVNIRDKKIRQREPLDIESRIWLCAFMAASQARTRAQEKHQKRQWEKPLKMMESLIDQRRKINPTERIITTANVTQKDDPSLSYSEVKIIAEKPMQTLLVPMINSQIQLLSKLDVAIFTTKDKIGFITSDVPCVWFDPQAYKRPPMYRAPALMYKTTEITLPISPNEIVCLNQHGVNGYFESPEELVDEFNKRTRFCADEYFVVNSNFKKDDWFDPGQEPEDSWENKNKIKK